MSTSLSPILTVAKEILQTAGRKGMHASEIVQAAIVQNKNMDMTAEDFQKKVLADVHRLGNALFTDLGEATDGTYGAAQRAVNKTGTFADPFSDTLYADRYRLVKIATDFFDTAFRAINTSICVARMQGV